MADNPLQKQPGRGPGRPFEPGQSGNPAGRPKGSRNAATRAVEVLLDGQAHALTKKAIDVALNGDGNVVALRLCLERIAPPRRASPIDIDLPQIGSLADLGAAAISVINNVADGGITPDQGAKLLDMIERTAKLYAGTELEARVRDIEARLGGHDD